MQAGGRWAAALGGWGGQAIRVPEAIEAGTAGWEGGLRGGQTQASVVAMVEAAGRSSVAAGGAFKTLQWGGQMLGKDLPLFSLLRSGELCVKTVQRALDSKGALGHIEVIISWMLKPCSMVTAYNDLC